MRGNPYKTSYDITITSNGLQKLLEKLNPHKAAGPDNIKPCILKELAQEIAPILSIMIFKFAYNTSQVPDEWYSAVAHPVFKK